MDPVIRRGDKIEQDIKSTVIRRGDKIEQDIKSTVIRRGDKIEKILNPCQIVTPSHDGVHNVFSNSLSCCVPDQKHYEAYLH